MKVYTTSSIFILVLAVCFFFPLPGNAQFANDPDAKPVLFSMTPEAPRPNEKVTLNLTSYLINIDGSTVTWYVNGKNAASGKGMRTFSLFAGDAGSLTTVRVDISGPEGEKATKSITIKPSNVLLMWEALSYTPPFYKGKTLLGPQSRIRLTAVASTEKGALFGTSNYVYTWSRDGKVLGSLSGYGKNTLEIAGPTGAKSSLIRVAISDTSGTVVAEAETSIQTTEPKLVVYGFSPLYGTLYNRAVSGSVRMNTDEVTFAAVPYFMNAFSGRLNPLIFYEWAINDALIFGQITPTITFRKPGGVSGTSTISVATGINEGLVLDSHSFSISY